MLETVTNKFPDIAYKIFISKKSFRRDCPVKFSEDIFAPTRQQISAYALLASAAIFI